MALKDPGPRPRPFKSRSFFPNNGYWYARIAGQARSLCRWTITDLAELDRIYAAKKEHYEALARDPEDQDGLPILGNITKESLAVKDLIALFIDARAKHVGHPDVGRRLAMNTYTTYHCILKIVNREIGGVAIRKLLGSDGPQVFTYLLHKVQKTYKPTTCNHLVTVTKMIFRWGVQNGLVASPPLYGTEFVSTGEAMLAQNRRHKQAKFLTAKQIRTLIQHAASNMKAMIYLGINCAYLQSDCSELQIKWPDEPLFRLHLGDDPYIRFDRVKTGEKRKCTLWPETVKALKAVIGTRTEGPVFLLPNGCSLVRHSKIVGSNGEVTFSRNDRIAHIFRPLCQRAGVIGKGDNQMPGIGFSALRSTFNTVAFNNPTMPVAHIAAIAWIMGHKLGGGDISGMADLYLKEIDNSSLRLVTEHVRSWLLKDGGTGDAATGGDAAQ